MGNHLFKAPYAQRCTAKACANNQTAEAHKMLHQTKLTPDTSIPTTHQRASPCAIILRNASCLWCEMTLVLKAHPVCWGHVRQNATHVSTCEELLVDTCLCQALASATAEKYFAKNRKNILEKLQIKRPRGLGDKGAPQTNLNS